MPFEKGGRSDKHGNRYEINCIIYELLKVINDENYSITIEPIGRDELGTDILVTKKSGKIEHVQCKARNASKDTWTVSDLKKHRILEKWKLHLDRSEDRSVVLFSPISFSFLDDLTSRANETNGSAEAFYTYQIENSSQGFQKCYKDFCVAIGLDIQREEDILKSISYLKRIKFRQITDYFLETHIKVLIGAFFCNDADSVYDALLNYVVMQPVMGKELTSLQIIEFLDSKNIKPRSDDRSIIQRLEVLNAVYRRSFKPFNDQLVNRTEFDECIKAISNEQSIIIHGSPGCGKSGCTEAILDYCKQNHMPCLALKLDKRNPRGNCKKWGQDLGFDDSIAYSLYSISRKKSAILIFDQLDALRWTLSSSGEAISVCSELIHQIMSLNEGRDKKIVIVLVCRTYDLENDEHIKELVCKEFKKIHVGPLDENLVKDIVGTNYDLLSPSLKDLLQRPSNLYIWKHLDPSCSDNNCSTTYQLIDQWVKQISKKAVDVCLSPGKVEESIQKLADVLDRTGRLYIPRQSAGVDISYLDYLVSCEIVLEENNKISFVHQSILDFYISTSMIKKYWDAIPIADIVGEKARQNPTRRYQIQMFLQNLLEFNINEFLSVGMKIIESQEIRFYIKHVFFEVLGQIQKIDENIDHFIVKYINHPIYGKYLFDSVFFNEQYISILVKNGILDSWYSDENYRNKVFDLLKSIRSPLSPDILDFIQRHAFQDKENDEQFMICFWDNFSVESEVAFKIRMFMNIILNSLIIWLLMQKRYLMKLLGEL